ncbi:hypothetical protein LQ567_10870 [Niabella pedocola]|uniref:Uncharacterized protein n=1 Tax=Niabella pedocola TaxID=1752077 RepID=A0ABS8PSL7_9BACT|nr:hypothetical protein [Niabella pedocola]MCD2423263.1 hypothetical protein [Niabella pedocola]
MKSILVYDRIQFAMIRIFYFRQIYEIVRLPGLCFFGLLIQAKIPVCIYPETAFTLLIANRQDFLCTQYRFREKEKPGSVLPGSCDHKKINSTGKVQWLGLPFRIPFPQGYKMTLFFRRAFCLAEDYTPVFYLKAASRIGPAFRVFG